MLNLRVNNNTKEWKWFVNNRCIGCFNHKTKVFSKSEKAYQRFRNLSDGPGHGFPYEIFEFLEDLGCKNILIKEEKEVFEISFATFQKHLKVRSIHGETKVFCSLKWFDAFAGSLITGKTENLLREKKQLILFESSQPSPR